MPYGTWQSPPLPPDSETTSRRISGGTVVGPSFTSTSRRVLLDTRSWWVNRGGVNTPDYGPVRRQHLPENPFLFQKKSGVLSFSAGRESVDSNPYEGTVTDRVDWSGSCHREPELYSLVNPDEVYMKARLQMKDKNTWESLLFFSEMRKTTDLLVDIARTIARSRYAWKHGDYQGVWAALGGDRTVSASVLERSASNRYLAFNYGILPLLQDAEDAAQSLSAVTQVGFGFTVPIRATVMRAQPFSQILPISVYPDLLARVSGTCKDSYRFVGQYRVTNPGAYALARFGLTNPASLVYEATTLSFVADWFLPIGDWLSSFDAGVGVDFESCSLNRLQITDGFSVEAIPSRYFSSYSVVNGSTSSVRAERISLPGLPQAMPTALSLSPGLLVKPGGQPTVAGGRLASVLALLRQRV